MKQPLRVRVFLLSTFACLGAAEKSVSLDMLPQGIRSLYVQIGANLNPLLPPAANSSVASVCFEPMVFDRLQSIFANMPRLYIVPAAVSDGDGIAMMGYYNHNGASSSLSAPAVKSYNMSGKGSRIVPVVSLRSVIASIPPAITLGYLMTDMQGHDYRALRYAGEALKRAHYVKTEVWLKGYYEYSGTDNDFCTDMLPLMLRLGFEPMGMALDTRGGAGENAKFKHCFGKRCFFVGSGSGAAKEYCATKEKSGAGSEHRAGVYGANAFWRLIGTSERPPEGDREWKYLCNKLGTGKDICMPS